MKAAFGDGRWQKFISHVLEINTMVNFSAYVGDVKTFEPGLLQSMGVSKSLGYDLDPEQQQQKDLRGTPLVVQWLRLYLPMQGFWVRSLVGKLRCRVPQGQKTRT